MHGGTIVKSHHRAHRLRRARTLFCLGAALAAALAAPAGARQSPPRGGAVSNREGLEVETVLGMHLPPIPWARVRAGLERMIPAKAGASSSDGRGAPGGTDAPGRGGSVESFRLPSSALGDTLDVRVYLPEGHDSARRYPAVYTFVGEVYFDRSGLTAWMDSAVAAGMEPVLVVALPGPESLEGWRPDTPEGVAFQRAIRTEVVPAVEQRYGASPDREGRRLLGFSAGANVAVDLAVRHPELFGRVAAQSPGWMFQEEGRISTHFLGEAVAHVEAAGGARLPAFWFVWGDGASEWESRSRANGEEVMRALRSRGAEVRQGTPIPGDHGLHQIRASLQEAFAFLLAPAPAP